MKNIFVSLFSVSVFFLSTGAIASPTYDWYPNFKFTNNTSSKVAMIAVLFSLKEDPTTNIPGVSAECTNSNTNIGYIDPGKSGSISCNPNYKGRVEQYRYRRFSVTFDCYKGSGYGDGRVRYTKWFPESGWYDGASITRSTAAPVPVPGTQTPISLDETAYRKIYAANNPDGANEWCHGSNMADPNSNGLSPRSKSTDPFYGKDKKYKKYKKDKKDKKPKPLSPRT